MAKKHYKERKAEKLAKREQRILERRKKQRIRIIGIILIIISIVIPVTVYAYLNMPNETKNGTGNEKIEIEWHNYDEGLGLSESENKPIMIDFYGYGGSPPHYCPPCEELDETTYKDSRVINESKEFVCIKVNCWDESNSTLCSSYNLEGVPTIVFLDSGGHEIHRFVGYRDADAFLEEMNKALAYS